MIAFRWFFDLAERIAARLPPRAALRMAGRLGSARQRLSGRWPARSEVAAIFGDAPDSVARSIAAGEARNRAVVSIMKSRGIAPLRSLAAFSDPPPAPAVLVTLHVGVLQAGGVLLERLPAPAMSIRFGRPFADDESFERVSTRGDSVKRAAVFSRALQQLRNGGSVMVAAEAFGESAIAAKCFGRELRLARGPFALARMAPAPVVPFVIRWTGDALTMERGPSFTGSDEQLLADQVAAWFEQYLIASPGEIGLSLLRELTASR